MREGRQCGLGDSPLSLSRSNMILKLISYRTIGKEIVYIAW